MIYFQDTRKTKQGKNKELNKYDLESASVFRQFLQGLNPNKEFFLRKKLAIRLIIPREGERISVYLTSYYLVSFPSDSTLIYSTTIFNKNVLQKTITFSRELFIFSGSIISMKVFLSIFFQCSIGSKSFHFR